MRPEIEILKHYETPKNGGGIQKTQLSEMNIMLFSSQEYFDYIYVFMQSLMESHSHVIIHLFIVSFVELNKEQDLARFIESRGHKVTFYILDRTVLHPFKRNERIRGGGAGFIRVIAHTFIEEKYDRMLFMDVDMVILDDIYSEFYNLDFDENYIISPANQVNYDANNRLTKENIDKAAALRGSYFNSALAVLNLEKLRKDISYNMLLEMFHTEQRIKNEQQFWGFAFAAETKYVDPLQYHVRWHYLYENNMDKKKMKIFHYDPTYVPFKPWDIYFEDDRYLERIKEYPPKGITNKYRPIIINKEINDFLGIWWKYAKDTPVYKTLYRDMSIIREFFLTYFPNICNLYNRFAVDLDKIRVNVNTDEKIAISTIRTTDKLTELNAINKLNSIPLCDYNYVGFPYDKINANDYLLDMSKNEDLILFMTAGMTAHFVINGLKIKKSLKLECSPQPYESYLAIIDIKQGKTIEKVGTGLLRHSYIVENKEIDKSVKLEAEGLCVDISRTLQTYVLLKSQGYNAQTLSAYNSILINNIDYAQTIKGLNIVVYSRTQNTVIDSCYVNTTDLTIKR